MRCVREGHGPSAAGISTRDAMRRVCREPGAPKRLMLHAQPRRRGLYRLLATLSRELPRLPNRRPNRGQKFFLRGRGGKATNLPELHTTTFCQRASTCCLLSRWEVYVWLTYFQFRATAAVETSQHDPLWARSSLEDIARAALLLRRRRLGQPLFALGHELLPFHL